MLQGVLTGVQGLACQQRLGKSARAREDEKATTATFGGSDVLRAAATTPLTPPPARESATDDDAGRARCDGTFAELGPSELARVDFPLGSWAALGPLAGELLGSRRVVPRRAEQLKHPFAYPTLEGALARELR